jgi:cell division septation protein DedD
LTSHTQDDGFHEIQLNGKQLVFLAMAATVVSVVIFLCGVLVGRGVRAERGAQEAAELNATADPAPQQAAATTAATPVGSDPTAAAPPQAADELSYFNRLDKSTPQREQLKSAGATAAAAPSTAVKPPAPAPPAAKPAAGPPAPKPDAAPAPRAATAARSTQKEPPAAAPAAIAAQEAPSGAAAGQPAGAGYAVQIAALNLRSEADAIAKRLSAKGYAAYVLSPATGTPPIYRVRIGKFGSRREAEAIATKLEKEEQFKPWVTR